MPGPSANASVGADMLGLTSEPNDALKETRRQIRATEAELTALAAKGDKVSAQVTANLAALRSREETLAGVVKRNRAAEARGRRALDIGEMTKAMIGAGSIKRILAGQADARDIAAFAFMAERQIVKGVKEVAGVRMARATRGVLRAIPFVGEAIGTMMEGWDKKKALEKSSDEINSLARAGKIDPATSRLYYASLTDGWFNDPKATVSNVQEASRGMMQMQRSEMQSALNSVKVKRTVYTEETLGSAGMMVSYTNDSLSAADVLKRYDDLMESDRANGVVQNKTRQESHLRAAIAGLLEDDKERDQIAEQLVEQVKKKMIEKGDDGEYLIRDKFQREENDRRSRILAARHYIPAKLEF